MVIIFLNDINIFMYIYIGENVHWDIYAPPLQIITHNFFSIFFFFFHGCNTISPKNVFFYISILGRSGVNIQQFAIVLLQ